MCSEINIWRPLPLETSSTIFFLVSSFIRLLSSRQHSPLHTTTVLKESHLPLLSSFYQPIISNQSFWSTISIGHAPVWKSFRGFLLSTKDPNSSIWYWPSSELSFQHYFPLLFHPKLFQPDWHKPCPKMYTIGATTPMSFLTPFFPQTPLLVCLSPFFSSKSHFKW